MTATCDGAIAAITGTTGGNFSFTTPPSDGASIDALTGTISGGSLLQSQQVHRIHKPKSNTIFYQIYRSE